MVVVTGATGSIGAEVVRLLAARGVPVRAVARRPEARVPGAETVVADFDVPASLPPALAGADQLILIGPGAVPADGPQPMVARECAVVDAAAAAEIEHVVKVSVLGAVEGGALATGAHAEIERHLAASGLPATVLRPSGFLQNLLTGVAGFTPEGDLVDPYDGGPVGYIDAADIAACAVAVVAGDAPRGGIHDLTGPRAMTHADLAEVLTRVLDVPVGVHRLTADEVEAAGVAQGLPERFAREVASLCRGVAAGDLDVTTPAVRELTGRDPAPAEDVLARHAGLLRRVIAAAQGAPSPR